MGGEELGWSLEGGDAAQGFEPRPAGSRIRPWAEGSLVRPTPCTSDIEGGVQSAERAVAGLAHWN